MQMHYYASKSKLFRFLELICSVQFERIFQKIHSFLRFTVVLVAAFVFVVS